MFDTRSESTKIASSLVVGLILIVALFLRLYYLVERGIVWVDEGTHLRTIGNLLHGKITYYHAEPGFILLGYLVTRIVGFYLWTIEFASAVAGVLVVCLVYLVGKRLYGTSRGMLAAAVAAVMGNLVFYARVGTPTSFLLLFFMASIYCFVKSRDAAGKRRVAWLVLSGLAFGYGFTCHSSLGFYCYLPFVWLVIAVKEEGASKLTLLKEIAILAVSLWIPILFFEFLPFALTNFAGFECRIADYFHELYWQSLDVAKDKTPYPYVLFYARYLGHGTGLVFLILALVGTGVEVRRVIREKSYPSVIPLTHTIIPFVIAHISLFAARPLGRSVAIALPGVCMMTAVGIDLVLKKIMSLMKIRLEREHALAGVIAVVVLVFGIWKAYPLIAPAPAMARAVAEFLHARAEEGIMGHGADMNLIGAYTGWDNYHEISSYQELADTAEIEGIRYFLKERRITDPRINAIEDCALVEGLYFHPLFLYEMRFPMEDILRIEDSHELRFRKIFKVPEVIFKDTRDSAVRRGSVSGGGIEGRIHE